MIPTLLEVMMLKVGQSLRLYDMLKTTTSICPIGIVTADRGPSVPSPYPRVLENAIPSSPVLSLNPVVLNEAYDYSTR